jgi:hypothetical protein
MMKGIKKAIENMMRAGSTNIGKYLRGFLNTKTAPFIYEMI